MAQVGKFASCVYVEGLIIKYEYVYVSDDSSIADVNSVIFNGAINTDALIPLEEDVIFLSSYQKTG